MRKELIKLPKRRLNSSYVRVKVVGHDDSGASELPLISANQQDLVTQVGSLSSQGAGSLQSFRSLANDRQTQYNAYDEMSRDPIISAALEMYADDATQYDEQGRVIWIESEDPVIAEAGNRLLKILEIPERAWKHIHQMCLYGDYYLKLYRRDEKDDDDNNTKTSSVKIVNDKPDEDTSVPPYEEYVEDVDDPATMFDLKEKGKTAGFVEVPREVMSNPNNFVSSNLMFSFVSDEVKVYRSDRFIHMTLSETYSRTPEVVKLESKEGKTKTYRSSRGKSILQDVYPVQKELDLLEDSLILNRLTRSPLIRLLEIELGNMPKAEVNNYVRRVKNLLEQHISLDTLTGHYKSFNAPGPVDNIIYFPVRNGKGSVNVNNLGGDVNIRDIVDIDYFKNKRAGALRIPKAYLGDDMEGSGLSNGGSLTRYDIRYARTVKRVQLAYIRSITTLLNLFFIDKRLDYVNKFTVRMTSPSTQEDLERNELILSNADLVSSLMSLIESLEGGTQKEVLMYLITNILKMPEISEIVERDETPDEEIEIDGDLSESDFSGLETPEFGSDFIEGDFSERETSSGSQESGGFTKEEFSDFEDELPG